MQTDDNSSPVIRFSELLEHVAAVLLWVFAH